LELVARRKNDPVERSDGTLKVLSRRSKADPFGEARIALTTDSQTHQRVAQSARRRNRLAFLSHILRQAGQTGPQYDDRKATC
jgi:hypothetical protein